jgi:predicted PurR-regulated permease PerM
MTEPGGLPRSGGATSTRIPLSRVPLWLRTLGTVSWLSLGVIALLVIAYFGLAGLSALLIPLVVAVVLGMIFYPLVDVLKRAGVPRALGAALVMLGLVAISAAAIWMAVAGVVDQWPQINQQLQLGWDQVERWLADFGLSLDGLKNLWDSIGSGGQSSAGLTGLVQAGFSSAAAFAFGLFIGAFLLYYLLKDWHTLGDWSARHVGLPDELGIGLLKDATSAIRRYFYGITLASIPVAFGIGLAMWLLGLPLAPTVVLVTFVTSYVPYLGAIFSGAFTVLIALGSGGITEALIMLAVVLVTQNGLQTIVQTKLTSDQLALHPIVNLGSTIVGATVAGLLGATLSAPIVAMLIASHKRIRAYYGQTNEAPEDADEPGDRVQSEAPPGV